MMKINSLFVIATAQLLPENEVPKFTGAKVSFMVNFETVRGVTDQSDALVY